MCAGLGVEIDRVFLAGDDRDDVLRDAGLDSAGRDDAHDNDLRAIHRRLKAERLLQMRGDEPVDAVLLGTATDIERAVTVGIGLEHRHERGLRTQTRLQQAEIFRQHTEIHFDPAMIHKDKT